MVREPSGHTRREYFCMCACGASAWREAQHVDRGRSRQCRSCSVKKHGLSATREYAAWFSMRDRCLNEKHPAYKYYGARGITVCERWGDVSVFVKDMGTCADGCSLERLDNSRGYYPENCVWASAQAQAVNRRNTVWLTAFGKTKHLSAWARDVGLRIDTLHQRLQRGWDIEKALTTPKGKYAKKL